MRKGISNVKLLIVISMIQLLILGVCFFLFLSKLSIIPWYTPLSSYLLLYFILLFIVQLIILFYVWFMREKYPTYKFILVISAINSMIILFMFLVSLLSILLFYTLAAFCVLIEIILFTYLVYSIISLLKAVR